MIHAENSVLLLVDLQARLMPAISDALTCLNQCRLLLKSARMLDVPVRATEHCPAGIGRSVPELIEDLQPGEIFPKISFDASAEASLMSSIEKLERSTIVVAGTEAHVCVLQTVLGLKGRGYDPVLVADAVASRHALSRALAIDRLRHHGVDIVSTEMVIFEWLKIAGTPSFKKLLPMIKSGRPEDLN